MQLYLVGTFLETSKINIILCPKIFMSEWMERVISLKVRALERATKYNAGSKQHSFTNVQSQHD